MATLVAVGARCAGVGAIGVAVGAIHRRGAGTRRLHVAVTALVGVHVDLNTKEKATNNGVPGVDVDTNKSRDRDMKASGAGAATMDRTDSDASRTNTRAARADRN